MFLMLATKVSTAITNYPVRYLLGYVGSSKAHRSWYNIIYATGSVLREFDCQSLDDEFATVRCSIDQVSVRFVA